MMIKLVITKPEKIEASFTKEMKGCKGSVVAVLLTRPYSSFMPVIKKSCNSRSCFFIDTLREEEASNLVYINPENLTGLSIAINQAQQSLGGKVTIIFDSINNLATRNSAAVLAKFVSFLLNNFDT